MAVKGKVPTGPGLPPKDAELMVVTDSKEPWQEYQLIDGSTIRLKAIVSEIWRVDGEYDAEGNPLYAVKSQVFSSVHAPEHLKRKAK